MTLGSYTPNSKNGEKSNQAQPIEKGQYKVNNYEFIVSIQQKGFGIVVEKHRLKSILNDYDLYQKVASSWQFPLSLFVSCVIGILGSKLAWEVNTLLIAQVTGFLYATTTAFLIWTCITGFKAYQASQKIDSVKDADRIFAKISCHDEAPYNAPES